MVVGNGALAVVIWCHVLPSGGLRGACMPDGGTEGFGEGCSVWDECSFGSAGPNFLEMTPEHGYF